MGTKTKIAWTDHTGNLWFGCTEVHAGCDFCYAKTMDKRLGGNNWNQCGPRRAIKDIWKNFTRWQKAAAAAGEMRFVFVGSMMDIFEKSMNAVDIKGNQLYFDSENKIPLTTGLIRQRFFNEVVPNCPNLVFLLLTKRPSNIHKYIPHEWMITPPANVMYGYSPVDKESAKHINDLLLVPGRHFLSMEPLLEGVNPAHVHTITAKAGPYTIDHYENFMWKGIGRDGKVDWIITGGESGHHARVSHPNWYRTLRDVCKANDIPFFFKQWGEWGPSPVWDFHMKPYNQVALTPDGAMLGNDVNPDDVVGGQRMLKFGKNVTGNTLDGEIWEQRPVFELAA